MSAVPSVAKDRLLLHLLKRLRRQSRTEVLRRAAEADILVVSKAEVDGVDVESFTAHPAMLEKSPREIARLVSRLGSREAASPANATGFNKGRLIFEADDELASVAARPTRKAAASRKAVPLKRPDPHGTLTRQLLHQVRQSAPVPSAAEVATMLLLARAVAASGHPLADILRILRLPQPIISLLAPVPGFEKCFLGLLRRGLVLQGSAALPSGYELGQLGSMFSTTQRERWRAVTFAGGDYHPDQPDLADRQFGRAALLRDPILGIAETEDRLPRHLQWSAQLRLNTGPLDPSIISQVFALVLGQEAEERLTDETCARLTLVDLAIAVRPGIAADQALTVLQAIARQRHADEQADNASSGDENGNTGKKSTLKKTPGRGDPGSGAEIIQPVRLKGGDHDRFVPRVETLTGYGEAAEWALSLKADLQLWREGSLAWEEMSTKLLLSGPPGTGKTSFARALCNSLQVPLVVSSVTTWLEPGYMGDVLKRMKAAFAEAESLKPSILFIDELDGIGTRRNQGEWSEYTNAIINRALELLDGATRSSGAIVVAATNHPHMIDPALLRSGRLEKHIIIPPPDTTALMGILRHHLRDDLGSVLASAPERIIWPDGNSQADADASAMLSEAAGRSTDPGGFGRLPDQEHDPHDFVPGAGGGQSAAEPHCLHPEVVGGKSLLLRSFFPTSAKGDPATW
ncbi:MAG TPA: ATP-binding protein [Tianweitania sediminis]|nr:ATP-binding protein [Tianweitania sediminis]